MHANLVGWLDRLEGSALPALPTSARELSRLLKEEKTPVKGLASVIGKDPGLTVALIRRMNAAKKKHLEKEVTTVAHALMLLGLDHLRDMAAGVPILDQAIADPAVRARMLALYVRADHAAVQAHEFARRRKDIEPDEIESAAQLHALGEMLLWIHAPAKMRELETLLAGHGTERENAEYVVFGFGIDEFTAALATRWGLPSVLQNCLLPENAGNLRMFGIMLSVQLARAAERGWYTAEMTQIIQQVARYLHLDFAEAANLVHRNAVAAAHSTESLQVTPAAASLIHPSMPEADPDYAADTTGQDDLCLMPQPQLYRRTLHELQQAKNTDLGTLLGLALEAMHEGIGLSRVVFATIAKDCRSLKARQVTGSEDDPLFNSFTIALEGNNLFEQLMRKPQSLWLSPANREKFLPLVPVDFRELSKADGFFALSVFAGDKPMGLFYADRHLGSCELDAQAYHQFKQLGMAAAKAMAENLGRKS